MENRLSFHFQGLKTFQNKDTEYAILLVRGREPAKFQRDWGCRHPALRPGPLGFIPGDSQLQKKSKKKKNSFVFGQMI